MYDETADARAEIQRALGEAQRANVPVLVVFGANWCGDCKVLDLAFPEWCVRAAYRQELQSREGECRQVDRNVDIAESYGVPLKNGIPAVAVLSRQGKVIYATRAGELADAQQMGDNGIYEFFRKVAPSAK